ncbi:protein PAT1 homolog 1 isoform X2 [Rhinatrema bivittatum]|uniref:protein PAT1 homolog 1 isoform X2 n=1 Tax=Rhinatrema bivittatum TaxID=194408 RepID=UPI00112E99C3|nr:protein PAT1 homolog 1 isoform X2 [Rhinatrema bivittatum]
MFRYESLEDCPVDEDEDTFQVLGEEDEDIDQFNDDTFGAGAIDDDWQEEHDRLAELEDKTQTEQRKSTPTMLQNRTSVQDETDVLGDHEENLAESLGKLVIENELEDPAIMGAIHSRPSMQMPRSLNCSIWDGPVVLRGLRAPVLTEEIIPVSIMKEYGLVERPQSEREQPERDLSERALPRRSSSPIIGSPPVRVVPIGTPPKQLVMPGFSQQQILCPKAVHIRAPLQQPFQPASYSEQMSPNQLCTVSNSSLLGHPFPPSVAPVLTQLQRTQAAAAAGRMSPSQFACVSGLVAPALTPVNTKLLQNRIGPMMSAATGFRPFFGTPTTLASSVSPASHLQNLRSQPQMFRADTTHLHPQHRRILRERQQQNRNQYKNMNGAGGDQSHQGTHQDQLQKDPYANLMMQREKDWVSRIQMMQLQSTDPYLDDYYYQNYFEKLEDLSAAKDTDGEAPKKERTKLITPQVAKFEHDYKPVQFAGSLGKLTVSSVNNPRKMIDAVVTSRNEDDESKEKQVRDKRRQTLFIIEKTFSLLLDVEDYERRYLQSHDSERPALIEDRKQKILEMYENLRGKVAYNERLNEDHFVQIMCIRKGKRMVSRILPFLSVQHAAILLRGIAHNLPFLIKKDIQDEVKVFVKGCGSVSPLCCGVIDAALRASPGGLRQQLADVPCSGKIWSFTFTSCVPRRMSPWVLAAGRTWNIRTCHTGSDQGSIKPSILFPTVANPGHKNLVLPCLVRPCSLLLGHLSSQVVIGLLQQLTNLPQNAACTSQPESVNPHLTAVLQNKFGLTLLYQILARGEHILNSAASTDLLQDNQWSELVFRVTRELLRIPSASLAKPVSVPFSLLSLFSRYVDTQHLSVLEIKLKTGRPIHIPTLDCLYGIFFILLKDILRDRT